MYKLQLLRSTPYSHSIKTPYSAKLEHGVFMSYNTAGSARQAAGFLHEGDQAIVKRSNPYQRFHTVAGFLQQLVAGLEGFFDHDSDSGYAASRLFHDPGQPEGRFTVGKEIIDDQHAFTGSNELLETVISLLSFS